VAVSTSGVGEELIKTQLASRCGELLVSEPSAIDAIEKACNDGYLNSPMLGPRARREGGLLALCSVWGWGSDGDGDAGARRANASSLHSSRTPGGSSNSGGGGGQSSGGGGQSNDPYRCRGVPQRVELVYSHSTPSMAVGFMSNTDTKPTASVLLSFLLFLVSLCLLSPPPPTHTHTNLQFLE
jgi:hypothetical protein